MSHGWRRSLGLWARTQQCMMGKKRAAATAAEGGGSAWGRGLWTELRLGVDFGRIDSRFYIDMQVALGTYLQ